MWQKKKDVTGFSKYLSKSFTPLRTKMNSDSRTYSCEHNVVVAATPLRGVVENPYFLSMITPYIMGKTFSYGEQDRKAFDGGLYILINNLVSVSKKFRALFMPTWDWMAFNWDLANEEDKWSIKPFNWSSLGSPYDSSDAQKHIQKTLARSLLLPRVVVPRTFKSLPQLNGLFKRSDSWNIHDTHSRYYVYAGSPARICICAGFRDMLIGGKIEKKCALYSTFYSTKVIRQKASDAFVSWKDLDRCFDHKVTEQDFKKMLLTFAEIEANSYSDNSKLSYPQMRNWSICRARKLLPLVQDLSNMQDTIGNCGGWDTVTMVFAKIIGNIKWLNLSLNIFDSLNKLFELNEAGEDLIPVGEKLERMCLYLRQMSELECSVKSEADILFSPMDLEEEFSLL